MYYDNQALLEDEGVDAYGGWNSFFNAEDFRAILKGVRENDPETKQLYIHGGNRSVSERIERMTEEEWEELGGHISNNTHLMTVLFCAASYSEDAFAKYKSTRFCLAYLFPKSL